MLLSSIIIVLGQRLCNNGSLPYSLQQRIQLGLDLSRSQLTAGIRESLIFTGGTTHPVLTNYSEASAMLEYVESTGNRSIVDYDNIILEELATNTLENAIYSLRHIINLSPHINNCTVKVVTNAFHLARAVAIFRHVLLPLGINHVRGFAAENNSHIILPTVTNIAGSADEIKEVECTTNELIQSELKSIRGLNKYMHKYGFDRIEDTGIGGLVEAQSKLWSDENLLDVFAAS